MDKRFTGIMRRSAAVILCLLFLAASFWTGGTSAASSMSGPCGTVEEIHAAFPESYWKSLEALLAAHPNWRFKAFYEGVTFEECMADTAEMMIRRNLVEGKNESYPGGYYYPTSWYSTDIEGAYNWAGNEFYGFDNGNMFQASEEAVRYCMDPRNWFTEEQIFQFLDSTIPFDPSVSEQIVEYIFSTIGVDMWVAPAEETGLFTYEPAEDTKVAGAYETNTAAGSQTETANESSSSSEAPVSSTEVQTESQAASSEAPGSSNESSEAPGSSSESSEASSGSSAVSS